MTDWRVSQLANELGRSMVQKTTAGTRLISKPHIDRGMGHQYGVHYYGGSLASPSELRVFVISVFYSAML